MQQDTQKLIGTFLNETVDIDRDAIHIAVKRVKAGEDYLRPGDPVKLLAGTTDVVMRVNSEYGLDYDGTIDPFLPRYIRNGQQFFMFLKPGEVRGMQHHWSHPKFDSPEQLSEAEIWLQRFADRWGMRYHEMLSIATDGDDYIIAHGRDLHGKHELDQGEYELFWQHIETVTGKRFDPEHRETVGWSCSC